MTAMIVITCIHHRGGKGFFLKGKPTFLSLLQHIKKNHDFNE